MFVNYVLSSLSKQKINDTVFAILRGFLAGAVAGIECKVLLPHTLGLCPRGLDPHGLCSCFRRISGVWATCAGVPQDVLGAVLVSLAKTVDCRLCLGHLRVLLEKTRRIIGDIIDTWADSDFTHDKALKMMEPTQKRQRRIDPHEVACSVALTSDSLGGAPLAPPASLTSRDLRRHAEMRMGVLMASTHLTFRPLGVMASIWDGVRLGNPAKELLLHVLGSVPRKLSSVLPPKVPLSSEMV